MGLRGDILLVGAPTSKVRLNEYFFAQPDDKCEFCNATGADLRYQQGETDSFGFEVLITCKSCLEKAMTAEKAWDKALDIEDKVAPAGQLYVFSAGDQMDKVPYCFACSKQLREVVSKQRGYETRCEPYGGLYPRDAKVELVDEATVLARQAAVRRAEQAEINELNRSSQLEEDREEERLRDARHAREEREEERRNYVFSGDDDA